MTHKTTIILRHNQGKSRLILGIILHDFMPIMQYRIYCEITTSYLNLKITKNQLKGKES